MVISFNQAAFLKYCNRNHDFNKTAVLGRQRVQSSKYPNKILNKPSDFDFGKLASESKIYDMFIDLGSSEYIFNISQSFKNIIKLIKIKKIPKKICYFFYY